MNLKTITQNHLNEWNQTANGANLVGIDKNLVRDIYHSFYEDLHTEVVANYPIASFTKVWRNTCNKWSKTFTDALKAANPDTKDKPEFLNEVAKVVNKFRGNVAEIFFEAAVLYARFDWVLPTGYEPVDPWNEEQLDGESKSPFGDYPIGIQIKNWNAGNPINRHVFNEAAGMAWKWMVRGKLTNIDLSMKPTYMYVVSFDSDGYLKDETNQDLDETMGGTVKFIGPKSINKVFSGKKCPAAFFDELRKSV